MLPPIHTSTGLVRGHPSSGDPSVAVFRGIPFADTTAGANRWRPPQACPSWEGVRDCDEFGAIPPQLKPGPLYKTLPGDKEVQTGEDCLNLNVWTPATEPELSKPLFPVYVCISRGKFPWVSGSDYHFDGTSLASRGIVVITFNYRLGILGWLAHPSLSSEDGHNASGNYGLLDQIACLEWIQTNIKSFGGDPSRVTISGQSAGSACVGLHLYGPLSKGLFSGAVFQSGGRYPRDPLISCLAPSYRTKEQAESEGVLIFEEKGARTVGDMRQMDLDKLLEGNHRDDTTMWGPPPFYRACLDGHAFPRTYEETLVGGLANDVPILNGQNKDESGNYTHPEFDDEDLKDVVNAKFGSLASRWHEFYAEGSALERWNASTVEASKVGPQMHHELWRDRHFSPIWVYHFTHSPPRTGYGRPAIPVPPKSKGYTYFKGPRGGAYHAAEIPYAFDSLWCTDYEWGDGWTSEDRNVANSVSRYWECFIKYGNPNGPQPKGTEVYWPSAAEDRKRVMELGVECRLIPIAASEERELFLREWLQGQEKKW